VINRKHILPFVGLPGGGIATDCPLCKGLEEVCESRISEYVKARSAAYHQASTELAAYKNVEMERARSELEEQPVRVRLGTQKRDSQHATLGVPKECEWQRKEAIRIGASRN
jgi:hypothetical protein